MRPEQGQLAVGILLEVMRGARCADAATGRGLSNTQARRLCLEVVGLAAAAGRLEFASPQALKSLKRLRSQHAQAVVEAIADFEPMSEAGGKLDEARIVAGLARLASRSRQPLRDAAMLCMLLATGMRPVEIVRLTVADCLTQSGTVREAVEVRAEVSVHATPRTVYFTSLRLSQALDAYLTARAEAARSHGKVGVHFRGLSPSSRLFQTNRGANFKVHPRPGGGTPLSPRAFEAFAQIFVDAGWPGLSSADVRRALRVRMIEQQARSDDVALMLDCRTGLSRPRGRATSRPLAAVVMDVL
jgi:integrase